MCAGGWLSSRPKSGGVRVSFLVCKFTKMNDACYYSFSLAFCQISGQMSHCVLEGDSPQDQSMVGCEFPSWCANGRWWVVHSGPGQAEEDPSVETKTLVFPRFFFVFGPLTAGKESLKLLQSSSSVHFQYSLHHCEDPRMLPRSCSLLLAPAGQLCLSRQLRPPVSIHTSTSEAALLGHPETDLPKPRATVKIQAGRLWKGRYRIVFITFVLQTVIGSKSENRHRNFTMNARK